MTLRISAENLKIGGIASQFCPHSKLNKKSQNVKKYFTIIKKKNADEVSITI